MQKHGQIVVVQPTGNTAAGRDVDQCEPFKQHPLPLGRGYKRCCLT